ncbi:hypothetical protein JSE7799_01368 [Jannaschia seosinensis]|uniref:Molybdate ABC transporter substrate-binding protein n=1 Tax=Jannaschia seosinensis TaxID=313367 RepID=A0A0M7B8G3_9RHOB|nr:hypothetical protein [Jannaschia seosinensis]CUH38141.1 hypothetical protein JSE7799_01368 [Jannaschia seosinensis]
MRIAIMSIIGLVTLMATAPALAQDDIALVAAGSFKTALGDVAAKFERSSGRTVDTAL